MKKINFITEIKRSLPESSWPWVFASLRQDALIWTLFLAMRRFDRFLHQKIYRREYPYILPGRIRR